MQNMSVSVASYLSNKVLCNILAYFSFQKKNKVLYKHYYKQHMKISKKAEKNMVLCVSYSSINKWLYRATFKTQQSKF